MSQPQGNQGTTQYRTAAVSGALGGFIWGLAEGLFVARVPGASAGWIEAALVQGALTAPLGIGLAVCLSLVLSALAKTSFPSTALYLRPVDVLVACVVGTAFVAGSYYVGGIVHGLQVEELAPALSALAISVFAIACLLVAKAMSAGLSQLFRRLEIAPNGWAQAANCVLGALCGSGLIAFNASQAPHLGDLAFVPMILGTLSFSFATQQCISVANGLLRKRAALVTIGLVVVAFPTAIALTRARAPILPRLMESAGGMLLVETYGNLSDVDRDGVGSLFGTTDCAPFDGAISPGSPEIKGNSIDENCDGLAPKATEAGETRRISSGSLPAKEIKRYNILWIVVDALRADRVGALGSKQSLTPRLDHYARSAWVFTQARSQSSTTRISIPSMLAGRYPDSMTWTEQKGTYQPVSSTTLVQQRMKKAGYTTIAIENGWFEARVPSLLRGFSQVRSVGPQPFRRIGKGLASQMTAKTMHFLESLEKRERFFLFAYYDGPHLPYHDLSPFGFRSESKELDDRYAAEVRYVDAHLGALFDYLQTRPKLQENTIVFVTADHGEEFLEHGHNYHSRTCYVESLHVPMLVWVPGQKSARVTTPVALVDIVPTMFEFTGIEPDMPLDGESLLLTVRGEGDPDRAISCTQFYKEQNPQFAKRRTESRGWSLVRPRARGGDELYRLGTDPYEQKNLAKRRKHRTKLRQLRTLREKHDHLRVLGAGTKE